MSERVFDKGAVTVGSGGSAAFPLPLGDEFAEHALFDVDDGEADVCIPEGLSGVVSVAGTERKVGAGQMLSVSPGDWGILVAGEVALYFMWVDEDFVVTGTGVLALFDYNLGAATLASAAGHGVLLALAFLHADLSASVGAIDIRDAFVRIEVAAPPDVVEEVAEVRAPDESMARAAGGEEGRFGDEDATVEESVLPDHDGPPVAELPDHDLGRAFEGAIAQTGAMTNIFGQADTFTDRFGADFATAGEGDIFVLGRGPGGLSTRGPGPGGGRDGHGRVHGVGTLETGGGTGTSASIGHREAVTPGGRTTIGTPTQAGGFLTRAQIERVVRRHSRGIRHCYERALPDDPTLGGRISANWTIGLDGRVQGVSIVEDTVGSDAVESCIRREIRLMQFDRPDGGMVVVTYPFSFRAAAR